MLRNSILATFAAIAFTTSALAQDPLDLDRFAFPEFTQFEVEESSPETLPPVSSETEQPSDEPTSPEAQKVYTLWATYYYLPEISEVAGPHALRDMLGLELGPSLSLKDWCYTSMEGSVKINFKNGESHTYNYQGITDEHYVDCSSIFPRHPAIGKTKFRMANGLYGDGVGDYILSPYRTVATDPKIIPTGTVLYIPEAKGAKITTATGKTIVHDGYFFAGDIGGAIKGNHIDVYIGTSLKATFFPWIKSRETGTFKAYVVTDEKIINELRDLHTAK